jgi:hypothetical protein
MESPRAERHRAVRSRFRRRRRAFVGLAIVIVAVAASVRSWTGPIAWTPDGCFYEAKVLELRGAPSSAALAQTFFRADMCGSPSEKARAAAHGVIMDRRWVRYSGRFYARRWLVPIGAAAIYPIFHTRSLEIVSLLGYVAASLALFALLRARFSVGVSGAAAALATLIPQYRTTALSPLTDTWGVALEAVCLLVACRYLQSGRRGLVAVWTATTLALALTRDNAVVPVLTVLFCALRYRAALLLAATGAAVAVVPSLAFGVHYRELLAYTLNGSRIPPSTSWQWIVHHYGGGVDRMLDSFVSPLRHGVPPLTTLAGLAGLAGLFGLWKRLGVLGTMAIGSVGAGILFLFSLPQPALRIAFVLLPAVAIGYAAIFELLARHISLLPQRQSAEPSPP